MEFDVCNFLKFPEWETFDKLKKSDLMKISAHNAAGAKTSMQKQEVENLVIQTLVDEEVFDESMLDKIIDVPGGKDMGEILKIKELELKYKLQEKLEVEKMKIQSEELMKQEELKIKKELEQAKLEFEQTKLTKELEIKKLQINKSNTPSFDPTKYMKFVPQFREEEVDQYFLHFEKVATNLKWPKDNGHCYYKVYWWVRPGRCSQQWLCKRALTMIN